MIPIPKKSSVKALNNLRPVALTSLVMIFKNIIIKVTDPLLDFLQFTYRAGWGIDDA